jgi:hypothetical protein
MIENNNFGIYNPIPDMLYEIDLYDIDNNEIFEIIDSEIEGQQQDIDDLYDELHIAKLIVKYSKTGWNDPHHDIERIERMIEIHENIIQKLLNIRRTIDVEQPEDYIE